MAIWARHVAWRARGRLADLIDTPPFDQPPDAVASRLESAIEDVRQAVADMRAGPARPSITSVEPRQVSWRPEGKCGLQPRISAWIDRLRGVPSVTACSSREKWLTPSTMTHSASSPADVHTAA